ncbi:MAG TPA: CPBP family intramembrane glutamic endopeptidase [Candidatus Limnocylindrales bacterium]|nr:CPBP family intramembrane glutamic endopeptidase [Candidatus Limnocylindrales bacterium]
MFIGPKGIRAGWRLAVFIAIFATLGGGTRYVLSHTPLGRELQQAQAKGEMTAKAQIIGEGLTVLILCIAAGIMTRIEKRTFADYGLPLSEAFGKLFWQGVPLGFAMLSLLLAIIAALHGFSLSGMTVTGGEAVKYGVMYGIGFILVGIFEEFSFRGYMQSTLASGMGFWPAALILSFIFGAGHLGNPGEAIFGAIMAGSFGLLAAFALRRTGNIWLPIGMHASWDWGETYFYGTPDSGLLAQGHFLNSSFHGPAWLTGGSVGPEGSWLVFAVLIIWALIIHLLFPARKTAS